MTHVGESGAGETFTGIACIDAAAKRLFAAAPFLASDQRRLGRAVARPAISFEHVRHEVLDDALAFGRHHGPSRLDRRRRGAADDGQQHAGRRRHAEPVPVSGLANRPGSPVVRWWPLMDRC